MLASKPHVSKPASASPKALPTPHPIHHPTLPDRTVCGVVPACPCVGLEVDRCMPSSLVLFLEGFLEAHKLDFD